MNKRTARAFTERLLLPLPAAARLSYLGGALLKINRGSCSWNTVLSGMISLPAA